MRLNHILPAILVLVPSLLSAHGDVTPQAVNTDALPDIGEEWLEENPWRDPENEAWETAIEIGSSAYNQNCARCHGLEVISGGLAPDLRYLTADYDGDEWYLERFRNGMTQNGTTKMPAFGEILGQKAAWAIRTYVETRPDDGALDEYQDQLRTYHDQLKEMSEAVSGGEDPASFADEAETIKTELTNINDSIATGSGAPKAESFVAMAANALDGSEASYTHAVELLDIGMSAAQ